MEIKKTIIVQHDYGMTTPKTQRMLAAAREYVSLGLNVVFIVSTEDTELDHIDHVRFIKIQYRKRNVVRYFYDFAKAINKEYDENAIILFYEIPIYSVLFGKRYNSFAEITEIPFYGHKMTLIQKIIFKIRLYAIKRFNGLLVISKSLKEYYRALGVRNIEVVNMFVDTKRFDTIQKTSSEKYVAYCGRISYYKDGVNDLITAFSEFSNVYPDFKLKIIGAFENYDIETKLKKLVSDLGLYGVVEFTGLISPDKLPSILKNASILALARPNNIQAQYGFPTKLGEFLATGNPVVVTKVGEIPLFLEDGLNAFLAEPENPHSFSKKMIEVVKNAQKAKDVGEKGRLLTTSEFSSVQQTQKAYNFMIEHL